MAVRVDDLLCTSREGRPARANGFRTSRLYYQLHHLTAGWGGARVDEHALIRSYGEAGAAYDLFLCVQNATETEPFAHHLAPDFRLHCMRSGHLAMTYTETNVDELASHYAHEIERIAPAGRLLVGGICQGGAIAFAVARKLAAAGKRPESLILIEQSKLPSYEGNLSFFYSEDGYLNPAKRFEDGADAYRRIYGERFTLDVVAGPHGTMHLEPYVHEFVDRLSNRARALGKREREFMMRS